MPSNAEILANSKYINELPENLNILDGDYVVVYSVQLGKAVKVKKSNVQFPTTSFVRGNTINDFPNTGVTSSLYLEDSTNKLYKWDSGTSAYKWLLEDELAAINAAIALKLDKGTYTGDAAGLLAEAKAYTDSVSEGKSWKTPVDVATTGNVVLSGEQTIDGVLTANSRILVKDQTDKTENGFYDTASGAWTRSVDADTGAELELATTKVVQGTANINKIYTCNVKAITLGTTDIVFVSSGDGTDHNSATGLQGGTDNEYFHLSSAEHDKVKNLPASSESTANKATDFSVIDDEKYTTTKSVSDRIDEFDDVKGYAQKSGFPATGKIDVLYIDRFTKRLWIWDATIPDYALAELGVAITAQDVIDALGYTPADDRLSNVASDLSVAEQDAFKTKLNITGGSSYIPPADYDTVALMLADQANQKENEEYTAKNASGWSTITHTGWATFKKKATSTAAEEDYDLREQQDFDNVGITTQQSLTDSAQISWDMNAKPLALLSLAVANNAGAVRTIPNTVIATGYNGNNYQITFVQDVTGGRKINFGDKFKVSGALNPAANSRSLLTFIPQGDECDVVISPIIDPEKPEKGTGTELSVSKYEGDTFNFEAAINAAVFTIVGEKVVLGHSVCLINVSQATLDTAGKTEPEVTGATKISGADFTINTNMELVVRCMDGVNVEYYFQNR